MNQENQNCQTDHNFPLRTTEGVFCMVCGGLDGYIEIQAGERRSELRELTIDPAVPGQD